MIKLLLDNPLLLLFVVVAIGYLLGRIKVAGISLGLAAILFVGLAFGSLDPNLKLPEIIYLLGLVLFVYTVGLSSGPVFFASLRSKGLRDNLLVTGMLIFSTILVLIAQRVLHLKATLTAGLFAGSLTNTPALAGVLEYIKTHTSKELLELMLAEPVIGYSVTYPMGVVAMLLAISLAQRLWRVNYQAEAQRLTELGGSERSLSNCTIRITGSNEKLATIDQLSKQQNWEVIFGRIKRGDLLFLAADETRLQTGDLVSVVGAPEQLAKVVAFLGETSSEKLELDRSQLDYRRIFVSNPKVAGLRLKDLNLPQQFGALITRLRRGDIELLPRGDTTIELGDRVRVLTNRENIDAVTKFFGDSYRALSEFDILTFSLGLALGLLLGLIPIPFPGGTVKLGLAGGPLIVSLILGARERTGPIVWGLSYNVNLTLRQVGMILFLAGVGTRAGYAFANTLANGGAFMLFLAGMLITFITALTTLWVGHKLFKIPMILMVGMLAGMQTQPAVLGFALEQTGSEIPNVGYATVYPLAIILKILFAQFLLMLLL